MRAALAAVVVAVGLVACGGDDATTASATTEVVTVKTFQFGPDPLEVEAGTTVRFVNEDRTTHTATGKGFDVELPEGGEGEVTLDEPGTYDYRCTLHDGPGMTGQIVVT